MYVCMCVYIYICVCVCSVPYEKSGIRTGDSDMRLPVSGLEKNFHSCIDPYAEMVVRVRLHKMTA